jgi:hypothetical protein
MLVLHYEGSAEKAINGRVWLGVDIFGKDLINVSHWGHQNCRRMVQEN